MKKRKKRGRGTSNTNKKTGMPTSNPLVQIPLSFLAITGAQGLSIWCMQEAVVIQWRFSTKQGQYYSSYNSMQKTPELSIALCATLQFRQLPANHRSTPQHKLEAAETPQAAAQGSSTSENLSRVHQLTLRYLCSPALLPTEL